MLFGKKIYAPTLSFNPQNLPKPHTLRQTYDTHVNWPIFLSMIISLAWGAHAIKALTTYVTSAIVGRWWHGRQSRFDAVSALAKGLSTSFGSICLSALVVVILRVVRLFVFIPMPPQRRSWAASHDARCVAVVCFIGL
jgi:hypothetical protein